MNPDWKNFLLSEQAIFDNDTEIAFPPTESRSDKRIYAIAHLGVLSVAGSDAANFLQGQVTCNVKDITDGLPSLGAMCNPKGRAITTFLLVKNGDGFLMILPRVLLAPVQKKLQMYVLRSKVTLTDSSDELCLIGLADGAVEPGEAQSYRFGVSRQQNITVEFGNRSLIIATPDDAQALWQDSVREGFEAASSVQWRYLDVTAGLPWLDTETSEEFVPQMLNLDLLNGISFNKGCYTGQEIVARTHYLGKTKRKMFVAECDTSALPSANDSVVDDKTGQNIGKVLCAQHGGNACRMLVVLQVADEESYDPRLDNAGRDRLTLLATQL
ncbi:MAG: CAF17-like 4Fe-4S cluster assembly/insertion protein YgfZ [Methylobacter sp.]